MSNLTMPDDFLERARRIRLFVLDVDGVLTDGRFWLDQTGAEWIAFDIQDGHGLRLATRAEDFLPALLTGRNLQAVRDFAERVGVEEVIQGAKKKLPPFLQLVERTETPLEEVAYMGDDLLDLPVMRRVGLPMAPADARPEVLEAARYVTSAEGGRGAVREALEAVLKAQGKWEKLVERYYE